MFECQFCNKKYKKLKNLSYHLNYFHKNISKKQYYDKYINPDEDKKCPICKGDRKFISLSSGYFDTCCKGKCKNEYIKLIFLEKYGVDNPWKSKKVIKKIWKYRKKNK